MTGTLGIDYAADRPCIGAELLSCGDVVIISGQALRVERSMDGGWVLLDRTGQPKPGWWATATIDR